MGYSLVHTDYHKVNSFVQCKEFINASNCENTHFQNLNLDFLNFSDNVESCVLTDLIYFNKHDLNLMQNSSWTKLIHQSTTSPPPPFYTLNPTHLFLLGMKPFWVSWLLRPIRMASHDPTTPRNSVSLMWKMSPIVNDSSPISLAWYSKWVLQDMSHIDILICVTLKTMTLSFFDCHNIVGCNVKNCISYGTFTFEWQNFPKQPSPPTKHN